MEYMDETTLAHKHTSPWLIAFRIIFTIALVWCILFIFHNSLETSSISSARSHEVMQNLRIHRFDITDVSNITLSLIHI